MLGLEDKHNTTSISGIIASINKGFDDTNKKNNELWKTIDKKNDDRWLSWDAKAVLIANQINAIEIRQVEYVSQLKGTIKELHEIKKSQSENVKKIDAVERKIITIDGVINNNKQTSFIYFTIFTILTAVFSLVSYYAKKWLRR